jgi:energy-coupling factor transporter ATP-binding protein EcfA2
MFDPEVLLVILFGAALAISHFHDIASFGLRVYEHVTRPPRPVQTPKPKPKLRVIHGARRIGTAALAHPPVGAPTPTPTQPLVPTPTEGDWIEMVLRSLHLLVIGHTNGGKTTLLHFLAGKWIERGNRVIVCDLDAGKGQWPGCEVFGAGDDLNGARKALLLAKKIFTHRNKLRAQNGRRVFDPIYVIIDEYADVAHISKEVCERLLRRGRKLNIHLIMGVQDKNVKTLKFEGQGTLREQFTYIVSMQIGTNGVRTATITNEVEDGEVVHVTPTMPDPDSFIIADPVVEADTAAEKLTELDLTQSEEAADETAPVNERKQRIIELAQDGLDPRDICQEVYGRRNGKRYDQVIATLSAAGLLEVA